MEKGPGTYMFPAFFVTWVMLLTLRRDTVAALTHSIQFLTIRGYLLLSRNISRSGYEEPALRTLAPSPALPVSGLDVSGLARRGNGSTGVLGEDVHIQKRGRIQQ
ncbi:hypothetical protein [Novosphingobium album (ex Hu et al. 2023)]|uniref:Uncharacterized protein n=1 Tax=Novosphingobium album (ex Hu et al. 2023) TaxID=2930093 RepID=A0ABT0AZ19_9SPHN|nr:hypothetical protein [Novosphingobium album (ex Hu et al. 2023)]MCJ2178042.1 hypothetical protein [Novosphingobium album (ex Hu et al. 2023)]